MCNQCSVPLNEVYLVKCLTKPRQNVTFASKFSEINSMVTSMLTKNVSVSLEDFKRTNMEL